MSGRTPLTIVQPSDQLQVAASRVIELRHHAGVTGARRRARSRIQAAIAAPRARPDDGERIAVEEEGSPYRGRVPAEARVQNP